MIYDNRFFSSLLCLYAKAFLGISGWKIINKPPDIRKFVTIAAPHTSNWDFPIFIAAAGLLRINVSFLGKHSLFEGVFGWLFYWLGGIPVNRTGKAASEVVDQAVQAFLQRDKLILGIAPEGTRCRVAKWKTGFYRIALAASVPIVPAFLDSKTKTIGFGEAFIPTGDIDADLAFLQNFYLNKQGINPAN